MRIISLCPSLTETVFALARGEHLVGITKFCTHPADGVRAVEKVGGTKDPNIKRILELRPTIVLMNEEENRLEDANELRKNGILVLSSLPRSTYEVARMVQSLGGVLDSMEPAEKLALEIESRTQRVVQSSAGKEVVGWVYLIWKKPVMAVNRNTFISELLTQAGSQNLVANKSSRYPQINMQDLATINPQRIFLSSEPFHFKQQHAEEFAAESGLPLDRFQLVDGKLLSWHGASTPVAIDYAASLIDTART
jgi:iron complex transport system substrate-binding protein